MGAEAEPRLSAELGRVLIDAQAAYDEWFDTREDYFSEEAAAVAEANMATALRNFALGATSEGLELADVQARLRDRFPVAAGETFFEVALDLENETETDQFLPGYGRVEMTSDNKREALSWLVNLDRKYQLPFTHGRLSSLSMVGTRSWSDYAQVVLQCMMADSLLNIEQKLDRLLDSEADKQ